MTEAVEITAGRLLSQRGLRLALAESCTGGLLAHLLTNVPGSSAYFLGSVVAYANQAKIALLGVRAETLEKHGAVSRETVLEMALGARRALQADLGLSISGIAGPQGGTPEKPVGTVWIALSAPEGERARGHHFPGERQQVKAAAARAALSLLIDHLEGSLETGEPAGREAVTGRATGDSAPPSGASEGGPQAIEALARFDSQGRATPVELTWQGAKHPVEAVGRRWEDGRGQHVLVMISGGRVFEALFASTEGRWFLLRSGKDRTFA